MLFTGKEGDIMDESAIMDGDYLTVTDCATALAFFRSQDWEDMKEDAMSTKDGQLKLARKLDELIEKLNTAREELWNCDDLEYIRRKYGGEIWWTGLCMGIPSFVITLLCILMAKNISLTLLWSPILLICVVACIANVLSNVRIAKGNQVAKRLTAETEAGKALFELDNLIAVVRGQRYALDDLILNT